MLFAGPGLVRHLKGGAIMSNSIQSVSHGISSGVMDSARPVHASPPADAPLLKPVHADNEPVAREKFDPQQFQQALKEIVERLNSQMKDNKRDLGFSMDDKINTFVVTVRNTETGQVIRQIPTEAVVKFAHNLEDLKGILFNQTM
jgi:flagellar protein FlaG